MFECGFANCDDEEGKIPRRTVSTVQTQIGGSISPDDAMPERDAGIKSSGVLLMDNRFIYRLKGP